MSTLRGVPLIVGAFSLFGCVPPGSTDTGGVEPASCGDALVAASEACDDGNAVDGDGCDSACVPEHGFDCAGEPSVCASTCGDAILASDEACDDGNLVDGDGCDSACMPEHGFDCAGEPSVCASTCGDAILASDEACDDGNLLNGDGCDARCSVEVHFSCTGSPSVCQGVCGDGVAVGSETCDDGNVNGGDGCDASCTVEHAYECTGEPSVCAPVCGDGLVANIESCDDGNLIDGDGCDVMCQAEHAFSCTGEPSACAATCGDGLIASVEECDDGNINIDDGCDASCAFEAFFTCSGEPSVCDPICGDGEIVGDEICDDGNTVNGDGCSDTCTVEYTEVEPNDGVTDADTNGIIDPYVGTIDPDSDQDWWQVDVALQGTENRALIDVEVIDLAEHFADDRLGFGRCAAFDIDSILEIYATDGTTQVARNDDGPDLDGINDGFCSHARVVVSADGTHYANVTSWGGSSTFSYALNVDVQYFECGDGVVFEDRGLGEECDDGNTVDGDGCTAACVAEVCGDGIVNNAGAEGCDDGNLSDGDGCDSLCQLEYTEVEPNDTAATANPMSDDIIAELDTSTDVDYIEYEALTDETITIETTAPLLGVGTCSVDTQLTLYDSTGSTSLATDDDSGFDTCSLLTETVEPGIHYIAVDSPSGDIGDYAIIFSSTPEFGCDSSQTLVTIESADVPHDISDTIGVTTSDVTISDMGTVRAVQVRYDDVEHTWLSDLVGTLVSPAGTRVDLHDGNGGSRDDFIDTFFDDRCGALSTGSAPFTGCFAPEMALSTFNTEAVNGTWTLEIEDLVGGDDGSLNAWTLSVCID